MKVFSLLEGGNVKIKNGNNIVSAEPIHITPHNRENIQHDVRDVLSHIHHSLHSEHGISLFGKNQKALIHGSAYSGSTKHLMDKSIHDDDFYKHKKQVGDVDVQVPHEHFDKLTSHLKAGKTFGSHTVVGSSKHGNEITSLLRHNPSGKVYQFDFEKSHYVNDEPTKDEQFLHSSHWDDIKKGIKGSHHKVLINATAGAGLTHKFSITHGLRPRSDDTASGITNPTDISKSLFGKDADHKNIHSFIGLTQSIKDHIPKEQHQAIYDKFKSGLKPNVNNSPALAHLRKHLHVLDADALHESVDEHHVSVIPLVGFSPISHMGHAKDMGSKLKSLPGTKHIGISSKADVFTPHERASILSRQWDAPTMNTHITTSGGDTIAKAYKSMPAGGKKHLHLLVGHDRKDFAENLKKSLEAGKVKEMEGNHFDTITIHHPDDMKRNHGLSGTKMRSAVANNDIATFGKHLGPMFSGGEKTSYFNRIKYALDNGRLKIHR